MSATVARFAGRLRPPDLGEGLSTDLLLVVLAWVTAGTVAGSHWVRGSEALVGVALAGVLSGIVLARLAPRATTFWLASEVGMIAVMFVATARHTSAPASDFVAWVVSLRHDISLALLVSMVAAAWLSTAWTAYWTLRRGQVPVALAPLATVMVVEVIDDPGLKAITYRVVVWMALAGLLLMRHTVARLGNRWGADRAPEVSSGVGVQGGWALVLILVAAFFVIPPLSTEDLSAQYFSGSSPSGGGAGDRPGAQGRGGNSLFSRTGYSERVEPGGTLVRSLSPVMEVTTDLTVPVYWRGIDLYSVRNGSWESSSSAILTVAAAPNQTVATDSYQARQAVHATIKVLGVPQNTIFWPGEPVRTAVGSQVRGLPANNGGQGVDVASVDGAYARNPLPPGVTYSVEASYSAATETQLRAAGTAYPAVVRTLTGSQGARPGAGNIDPRVQGLARQVAAAQSNPYDKVKAIETYLRTNLRYSLEVKSPPPDQDPILYFLFGSRVGYCEYFASSMGEMVRSLGIPVRVVDGYGPGSTQAVQLGPGRHEAEVPGGAKLIRASDAHTWVEVFFPNYGWIPFEPTPDPLYPALDRSSFDTAPEAVPAPVPLPGPIKTNPGTSVPRPSAELVPGLVLAALALLVLAFVLLFGAIVARGPARLRNPETAWRRLGWLAARRGQPRRPSDTPVEFTGRLARAVPSLGRAITELGQAYSQWCYRREGVADLQSRIADDAWRTVRRAMIRELVWPHQGRRPA